MTDQGPRERGKDLMRQVYGWDFDPTKEFERQTVDHLFGTIWDQGKLSVRDRRLVLIGLAAGSGLEDVAGPPLDAGGGEGGHGEVEILSAGGETAAAAAEDDLP